MRNVGDGRLVCAVKKTRDRDSRMLKRGPKKGPNITCQSFFQFRNFCALLDRQEKMRLIFICTIMHVFLQSNLRKTGKF